MSGIFTRARTTNSTDATFPSRPPTVTRPSGDGVHVIGNREITSAGGILIVPFGTGAENDVFNLRVLLWVSIGHRDQEWWMPIMMTPTAFACTMCNQNGFAGKLLEATDYLCDTITNADTAITSGSPGILIISPGSNLAGYIAHSSGGAQMVEILFAQGSPAPTGMNALVSFA